MHISDILRGFMNIVDVGQEQPTNLPTTEMLPVEIDHTDGTDQQDPMIPPQQNYDAADDCGCEDDCDCGSSDGGDLDELGNIRRLAGIAVMAV